MCRLKRTAYGYIYRGVIIRRDGKRWRVIVPLSQGRGYLVCATLRTARAYVDSWYR